MARRHRHPGGAAGAYGRRGPARGGAGVGGERPRARRRDGGTAPDLLGHRKVGLVLAGNSPHRAHLRRGWLEASAAYGLDPDATVQALLPDARSPDRDAALDDVLDRCQATGTTALLVHADPEAVALVQHCEERHLAVPGDLSVVAYDDEVAGLFTPPLTAVRPPRRSIGRAAVRLVADRLADPDRPAHRVVISPALRIRESTAPPRA
ncbi:substrate-binding domain-containing protein [Luedemannella flava]